MGDEPIPPMFGLRIEVCPHLVDSKCAYRVGDGPVYVSPAMFDLMGHADGRELELLLRNISILKLPALSDPCDLPVTVRVDGSDGASHASTKQAIDAFKTRYGL